MRQPKYIANVHTPEVAARRGRSKAAWFAANSPEAIKEKKRFADLNPMSNPEVREKVSRILKRMKHGPSVRGGNGKGLTVPQKIMLDALGDGWVTEFPLSWENHKAGYPSHYKLDLANVERKVNIEVDGFSHQEMIRKGQDKKRDALLRSLGWTVLRFWNADILSWSDSGQPMESYISMTLAEHGIRVFPSTDC
jgi:hypothetical protein